MVPLSFGVLSLLHQGLLCNGAGAGVCVSGGGVSETSELTWSLQQ